jgi:hypothetical protein
MVVLEFEGHCLDICMPIHFSDKSDLDRDLQKQCPQGPRKSYSRLQQLFDLPFRPQVEQTTRNPMFEDFAQCGLRVEVTFPSLVTTIFQKFIILVLCGIVRTFPLSTRAFYLSRH